MDRRRTIVLTAALSMTCAAMFVGQWSIAGGVDRPALAPPDVAAMPGFTAQPISSGPDLIYGQLSAPAAWGGLGGVSAYSIGLTPCNIGDVPVNWVWSTSQHPVMGNNLYRVSTGNGATRIEQLAQSWLKQGFCALQGSTCGACTSCGDGCESCLGAGCSSPYTSSGFGQQNQLGPRFEINAASGSFSYPHTAEFMVGDTLFKRMQVSNDDLNPSLNPGSSYYGEGICVHPQDAAAGNGANNASHSKLVVGALSGTAPNQFYQMSLTGPTTQQLPAIYAWKTVDPSVTVTTIDVPGDGRFVVAHDVTNLGSGQWHYEYAIYNINSHRSGEQFTVPIGTGAGVTNVGFRDIDYHSQSVLPTWAQVDNVDWTPTVTSDSVTWSTSAYTGAAPVGNEHTANALRWGTMYNFRFDADAPPVAADATLDLFRPGLPSTVSITLRAPGPPLPCPADFDASGTINGLDLAFLLGEWGPCPTGDCIADLNGDGIISGLDLALTLGTWGPCK